MNTLDANFVFETSVQTLESADWKVFGSRIAAISRFVAANWRMQWCLGLVNYPGRFLNRSGTQTNRATL
jgi:hypothetical protein